MTPWRSTGANGAGIHARQLGGVDCAGNERQSIRADLLREFVGRGDQIRPRFDADHLHRLLQYPSEQMPGAEREIALAATHVGQHQGRKAVG